MTNAKSKSHETALRDASLNLKAPLDHEPKADFTRRALLANLRHELRTPLNAIIGYCEMLIEDAQTLEAQSNKPSLTADLERIHTAGRQLLGLVNKTLDPAKIKMDHFEQDPEAFGAHLRYELRTPLNAVIGYSEMLLEDARERGLKDFMPDLQKIDRAARRFLALISDIVTYLKIQSGEMATDIEILSASSGTASMIQEVLSNIRPQTEAAASMGATERGSLLVVDDKETNRDLLARHLARQGHTVVLAENGRQALEMIQKDRYDLVLLDVIMPEINGYQVLQRMKSDARWKNIPVIMISALEEIDSVVQCIDMGAEDYLPKPFNPVMLRARINACLEKKRLRDIEQRYAESMEKELETGRQIQRSFFPEALPQPRGWEIAAFFQAARQVSGDFYDGFLLADGGQVGLVIGDVCDKGVGSALFMALIRSLIRVFCGQAHLCEHLCDSYEAANRKRIGGMIQTHETISADQTNALVAVALTNDYIAQSHAEMGMFATLFFGVLDPLTGRLAYINGGHEPPIIVGPAGIKQRLEPTGPAVGIMPEATFKIQQVRLAPGDILIGYTDGVTEARSPGGELFTKKRLQSLLKQPATSAAELLERITTRLSDYTQSAPQYDDITMLVVQGFP